MSGFTAAFAKHIVFKASRHASACFTTRYEKLHHTFHPAANNTSAFNIIHNYSIDKDHHPTKMATEAAARAFFSAPYFAVVGASSDPTKFGHKIFTWYTHHKLNVTPINPSSSTIKAYPPGPELDIKEYTTLPNLTALPDPTQTSVSIITPPKITKLVLEEAKKLGIKGVWLQPGTFDDEILKAAFKDFEAAVGGDGGRGGEGWCVLVDGERAAEAAGLKL